MKTGFAIALAWPDTYCKQPGSWYDGLMKYMGISENHYYKVGHAAIVLIESKTGICNYFDFGRYHAPFGYGRVRDKETDHDLIIKTKAIINDSNEIENFEEILSELDSKKACHGIGTVHAAYCDVNFEHAYNNAKEMQNNSPFKYGPFIFKGTNCSRFVRTIVLSGKPPLINTIKISLPLSITPTPIENVKSLNHYTIFSESEYSLNKIFLCQILPI